MKIADQQQTLWDALWINVNLATMVECEEGSGAIIDGAIAVTNSRISWVGKRSELTEDLSTYAKTIHDCRGRWLTPGLIDCHTHLVYGGDRAQEFEMRLNGVSYEEIANRGGGIRSTVEATRSASQEELVSKAGKRLEKLLAEGVTTVEIKSGYGLDSETELRMLEAAKKLGDIYPVNVCTTFLGAHTIPKEYESNREAYIDLVCEEMLPAVVKGNLADAVDVFCETIGFSVSETQVVLDAAKKCGLKVKLHADQLTDSGGAALAARYDALSADHIEYASEESVLSMAKQDTVAVLLPGAYYFLREDKVPPVEMLRKYNVPMAIATDSNPGSSPTTSLLLMMNMSCTLFKMTPEEALRGVTLNAAKALGIQADLGSLEKGKIADFALWDVEHLAELCYWIGTNCCFSVVKDGNPIDMRMAN